MPLLGSLAVTSSVPFWCSPAKTGDGKNSITGTQLSPGARTGPQSRCDKHCSCDSLRFPIAPGHDVPEIEKVVEENERYVVVEKIELGGR
jgi:hypothetical protein